MKLIFIMVSMFLLHSCGGDSVNLSDSENIDAGYFFAGEGETDHTWATRSLYGSKQLVLTYDDYPAAATNDLLDLLEDEGVKATFFYNTERLNPNSAIVQRVIREGHILATHQRTHESAVNYRTRSEFESELASSIDVIERAYDIAGVENQGVYFRYPYGAVARRRFRSYESLQRVGQQLYNENCINYVFWDVDTLDWALRDSDKIFVNVK